MEVDPAEPRLARRIVLAYGTLGFPLAALNLPLYVYLPAFFADEIGLGLASVGAVLLAARLLDVLSDPAIGELSDRLRSRFGRRRPWLVLACPLLLVGTWMLFVPAPGAGAGYLLFWSSLAYLAWTAMLLPYAAWGAELTDSYHERSAVTASREGFVILGVLFAAALPVLLGVDGDARAEVLRALAWIMVVLLPALVTVTVAVVPEPPTAAEARLRLRDGLRVMVENRAFTRLIGAYLLNGVANGLPATLFLLYVSDLLMLPGQAGLLLLLYFGAGCAAIPFWLRLSYRLGKHRAWSLAMLWASAVFVWVPLLGAGDFWPFLLICVLSGLSLGADLALPASMQADVVDLDRVQSGRRRTGLFFALWSMSTKLALALAVGIAFPVLDLAGFDAGKSNSAMALATLAVLYGLVPVVIKLTSIALVWNFPVDAAMQAKLRREIAAAGAPAAG